MEYVDGPTLKTCLRRHGRFRVDDAAAIMLQVLDALAYAHARGVVHRDIKPANVMVLPTGIAKLTDFGVAHVDAAPATQVGAVFGTPGYMAPEQHLGRPVGPATDLYAVAVVLLELVTGVRPPPGGAGLLLAGLRAGETDAAPGTVPPGFIEVLARALADAPAARFATAAEMAAAIRHSLVGRGATAPYPDHRHCAPDDATTVGVGPRAAAAPLPVAARPAGALTWDPQTLAGVERALAEHIGPLARLLVRRHAPETADLHQLGHLLANRIGDDQARTGFLRTLRTFAGGTGSLHPLPLRRDDAGHHGARAVAAVPTGSATGSGASTATGAVGPLTLDPREHQRLTQRLREQVGPMANLLLRDALREAGTLDELTTRLAALIPDPAARDGFLAAQRGAGRSRH